MSCSSRGPWEAGPSAMRTRLSCRGWVWGRGFVWRRCFACRNLIPGELLPPRIDHIDLEDYSSCENGPLDRGESRGHLGLQEAWCILSWGGAVGEGEGSINRSHWHGCTNALPMPDAAASSTVAKWHIHTPVWSQPERRVLCVFLLTHTHTHTPVWYKPCHLVNQLSY